MTRMMRRLLTRQQSLQRQQQQLVQAAAMQLNWRQQLLVWLLVKMLQAAAVPDVQCQGTQTSAKAPMCSRGDLLVPP